MNYYQYQTVLGLLTICEENDAVIAINVGHYSENKGEKRESELIGGRISNSLNTWRQT